MSHRNAMFASVAFVLVLLAGIVTLRDRLTTSADTVPTTSPAVTDLPTGVAVAESGELPASDATPPETNAWTDNEYSDDEEHRAANPDSTPTPQPARQYHPDDEEDEGD